MIVLNGLERKPHFLEVALQQPTPIDLPDAPATSVVDNLVVNHFADTLQEHHESQERAAEHLRQYASLTKASERTGVPHGVLHGQAQAAAEVAHASQFDDIFAQMPFGLFQSTGTSLPTTVPMDVEQETIHVPRPAQAAATMDELLRDNEELERLTREEKWRQAAEEAERRFAEVQSRHDVADGLG